MSYHVFSLPPALLESLTLRNLVAQTPPRSTSPLAAAITTATTETGARACNVCLGATFLDVEEQRAHFRTDWHRYNVKTRLNGGQAVAEAEFTKLVDALEDSISGSESPSEAEDGSESDDAVDVLMSKTKRVARSPSPSSGAQSIPRTALAWFHSPPTTQIGVYKALFPNGIEPVEYLDELRDLQNGGSEGRTWAMFMVAGGHFAGAVVRVSKPRETPAVEDEDTTEKKKKKKPNKPKPDTEVLKHKTFHRYTTRRKQGGSQSVNDNSKGNAKSAGAQLRRYGEQALREDIRGLLTEWADEINGCDRIWIRASGSNRKIFIDYEGAIIPKGDDRLRTFPFPTRRPTQSELSRCLLELTRVKTSHLTEDALRLQDEAYLASLPKPKAEVIAAAPAMEKLKQPKLSAEEELIREKWTRLLDMIHKGRLEPLKAFWTREGTNLGGIDVVVPESTGERRRNLLQIAAASGNEELTQWMLEDEHANPTIVLALSRRDEGANGEAEEDQGVTAVRRVAYDLAQTREVRNVFRRSADMHPDWWDWFGAARVPSGLSKEMEELQDEKKKMKRKGLKERVKEREAKEREREKEKPIVTTPLVVAPAKTSRQETTGPRKLGGAVGADGVIGLSPEMRARVERERRARAAEARMKAS